MAGNTPFRRWKREVHEGGVADPCIVAWPGRFTEHGGLRRQFAHAIDVMPTVLDVAGVEVPADLDGTSFAYALDDATAEERHGTQYFEMLGSRAIYHRGWKAVTFHPLGPMYDDGLDPDAPFSDDVWELYHVTEDLSETVDLAGEHPERLRDLVDLWWDEARSNDVLPLDNRPLAALLHPRPHAYRARDRYVYHPGGAVVPEAVAVNVRNRDHTITAHVDVASGATPSGVLVALGSALGGWSLYVLDGRLHYVHNLAGKDQHRIASDARVGAGSHTLAFRFVKTAEFVGTGTLLVDDEPCGTGDIPFFTPVRFSITGAGLTVGYELGPAISHDYTAPFPFDETLQRVEIDVHGEEQRDVQAELEAIMREQ
jgi:arylsulfatase